MQRDPSLPPGLRDHSPVKRQAEPPPGALVDFQVYEPVLTPTGSSDQYGCVYTQVLMEYDFANSYGAPFVGEDTLHPPIYYPILVIRLCSQK